MLVSFLIAAAALAADPEPEPPDGETIIVTGERVRRTLRETPSSVAVLSESDIEAAGADRLDQMLPLIPNVQLGGGSQGPAIRGQDTTGPLFGLPAFLGGNRPKMALVVDGRTVTYSEFVLGVAPVWDVGRIEVFRSPQTTTQGQNSIAGAIFVNSNEPGFTPEYRTRLIGGDFKTRQVSALASGPLAGDELAFRVTGDLRYSRTTSRIEDVIEGGDPNHDVFGLLRAKLLLTPSSATRMTLTYVHSQSQAPQTVGVDAPFRDRRDDSVAYGVFRINVDSLTAAVRHRMSPDLTLNLVLSGGDSDSVRLAIPRFGQTRSKGRDWSSELVLDWSPGGSLRIVGGVSHNHVGLKQSIDLSLLSGAIGRFRDWQDGTGVFADATLVLSPKATMSAGIRYQRDRQKRQGALRATTYAIPVDFVGTFDAWLPKVTFAYDLTRDLRIGAMVLRAYNPGGTTIRFDTLRPNNFAAERLWNYELFARAELAGGRATASANLFYNDIQNAQRADPITILTPDGRRVGFASLFNVPKARSYGAEGELHWRATGKLSVRVAVGLLDTKVVRSDPESLDLDGNQFDRSPHFTGSAAIDWRPSPRLRASAQIRHHSGYFTDPENTPDVGIGDGTNVDARLEYWTGPISLFVQVRNLFDALNMLALTSPTEGTAEDPRRIAVGLEARF